MTDYEAKQAARRDRYDALAQKNAAQSAGSFEASQRATQHIPIGQPILVGHHSEGRHRAALKRSDSAMRKACEATAKAEYYQRKADSVGKGGVSSDDPDAVEKLRIQLQTAQKAQERMKLANGIIRRHKADPNAAIDALVANNWKPAKAQELLTKDFAGRIGFPAYALQNNNANIRRIEERIKVLESNRTREDKTETGPGYTYEESTAENRVMFLFDGKPADTIRDLLKSNGFKWSPNRSAWVRHLNNTGVYYAKVVREKLAGL